MANPYLYATPHRNLEHIVKRGSVMSDVDGNYYISCSKHPEIRQPAVRVSMDKDIIAALERAFDSCSGCLDEAWYAKKAATTRFPEDAEL